MCLITHVRDSSVCTDLLLQAEVLGGHCARSPEGGDAHQAFSVRIGQETSGAADGLSLRAMESKIVAPTGPASMIAA